MKRLFSSENETNPTNNKRSLAPKYPSHHSDQTDPPYLVMSGIDPVLCSSLLKLSANKYSMSVSNTYVCTCTIGASPSSQLNGRFLYLYVFVCHFGPGVSPRPLGPSDTCFISIAT